ncbi:rhodanese-like domain-containing protein [Micromonospora sp. WMMA1363]|uniref:rhodanese-like domain-containing protein n=1 Tax=Micromonospora sp. WMMA1363 TaxID=3053985 RepID=UPI00259CD50F|nr:rhodanese-like domain-containing protein [Micromonospora sp. WMMA1363]MDM4718754.1 rhodanese-like domain-containing protein [Micromonospora sp. WMMA1363]
MSPQNGSTIDVATARALMANNPDTLVVDVRTPGEFETAHLPGSINLPLDQVDAHLERIVRDAGGRMLLMCQSGSRATQACTKLTKAGLAGGAVITGGMNAWLAAGGPVERGRERWSLERQVRLVAGSMVLASILASIWAPAARYVAGFIGAGLTYAAVSDTCAMGMLLAKLPYNAGATCDVNTSLERLRREESTA